MAHVDEAELDLRVLMGALGRRLWLLVALAVIAAIGTYVALSFVQPQYTADTRILIEERESPLTRESTSAGQQSNDFDESAILSQVEVLRSREIADAVIDRLELTRRPEFDPASQPSTIKSLMVALGVSKSPTDSSIRQRVTEAYFDRLKVYTLARSRVVGVDFSAPNPELAAEVANAVSDAFVALQQQAKRESAVAATDWLEQEIDRLRGRVAESEKKVADYRNANSLFDVDRSGNGAETTLSSQQLSELNAELARSRAARAEAEARSAEVATLLKDGGSLEASAEVLNSQLIQRLRERQVALRTQLAELSTTLLPTHPRIRSLDEQISGLQAQIRDEASRILSSLQTAARVAAAREESLVRSLNNAKVDASASNDQGIELRALEREAAAQRDLLESFLSRYRESSARTDANYLPADARIISRAVAPEDPSFPKKAMMSIAAAIAMLLIATAIIMLREFMSGRAFRVIDASGGRVRPVDPGNVSDPVSVEVEDSPRQPATLSDVARSIKLIEQASDELKPAATSTASASATTSPPPIIEATYKPIVAEEPQEPSVDEEPSAVAPAKAADVPTETAETAAAPGLVDVLGTHGVRIVLFAGANGGEGAGGIAFNAARELAAGTRCILIDVGRIPSDALGNVKPGLLSLLTGEASFGEVIQRDVAENVHVISLGADQQELPLARMRLVIGALTHTYEKVIVIADKIDDWPHEHVRPDLAAIVCGPETTDDFRAAVYETALDRGAQSAIIVRFSNDSDTNSESAAA